MNLLIDIGNTRAKFVTEENGSLSNIVAKENDVLDRHWLLNTFPKIEHVVIASVSKPELTEKLRKDLEGQCSSINIVATPKCEFGLTNSYQQRLTMGIDRWLAMLGARQLFPNVALIVIDAGTAITIDAVDSKGIHLGGWIVPGIELMFNGLVGNTAAVKASLNFDANTSFGNNTNDCVNQGIKALMSGAIEAAILQAERANHCNAKVVITGGDGQLLQALSHRKTVYSDELVFLGLSHYLPR